MGKWTDEMDRAALLCMLFANHAGSPTIDQKMIEQLGRDLAKYGVSGNGARQRLQALFRDYKANAIGGSSPAPAHATSAASTPKKTSPKKRKASGTPDVKSAGEKRIKVEMEEGGDVDEAGDETQDGITDNIENVRDHGVTTDNS
ncbi:MAG: hypothetical protein Q9220_002950 [cf. Caloplaca sp. 1 TL-2023]